MRGKAVKTTISYILSICCIFAFSSIAKPDNVYASYSRYVTASSLNVRKTASSKGKVAGYYKKGTKVTCYSKKGSWTRVKYGSHKYYVSTKYLSTKKPTVSTTSTKSSTYTRYVTASSLTIRKKASTSAAKAGSYKKGTSVTCYGNKSGWTTVKYSGNYCYVSSSYLSASKPSTTVSTVAKGRQVANYAKQFIGNPYKWGGESLTKGADCSGFTMRIFEHFGVTTGRTSRDQAANGKEISLDQIQPGDLLFYASGKTINHVALYIGDGKIIHASTSKIGIIISTAYYRTPAKAVTFLD